MYAVLTCRRVLCGRSFECELSCVHNFDDYFMRQIVYTTVLLSTSCMASILGTLQVQPNVSRIHGTQPSLLDLLRQVVPLIKERWKQVGNALGVEATILNTVEKNDWRTEGCALELLALWLFITPGTGTQHRTWHSVLGVVEKVMGPVKKEGIEAELQTMSSLASDSAFDDNCRRKVSICMCQSTIIAYRIVCVQTC